MYQTTEVPGVNLDSNELQGSASHPQMRIVYVCINLSFSHRHIHQQKTYPYLSYSQSTVQRMEEDSASLMDGAKEEDMCIPSFLLALLAPRPVRLS